MLILTVNGLEVLGPVLAQGPVSRLTVNNPNMYIYGSGYNYDLTVVRLQFDFDSTSI